MGSDDKLDNRIKHDLYFDFNCLFCRSKRSNLYTVPIQCVSLNSVMLNFSLCYIILRHDDLNRIRYRSSNICLG